jgi:hypothetical protein
MSLAINVDRVTAVLLADGWHRVYGKSFDVDAYEFIAGKCDSRGDAVVVLAGGQCEGVASAGAIWEERGARAELLWVACPLTSILAMKVAEAEEE